MVDKLIYIPNDDTQNYPFVDYNYRLKHLDTQLNEVPKNVKPTNRKTLL